MPDAVVESLIVDFLVWLAERDRTYEEVMDVWRTLCPKLPVWEDSNDRKLVARAEVNGRTIVQPTASRLALLDMRKSKR